MLQQPADPELTFRRAQAADTAQLRRLFAELKVPIAGSLSGSLQRGMIAESMRSPQAELMVAVKEGQLVGLGLAIVNPRSFWRGFVLRHPRLLIDRGLALLRRKVRMAKRETGVPTLDCSQYLSPPSGRRWGESSPELAHVLIVTLRPELRGAGAGPRLFAALLEELARRGVRRFDSRIAKSNLASMRMCQRMGIHVEEAPGTYFVTADLPWRSGAQTD